MDPDTWQAILDVTEHVDTLTTKVVCVEREVARMVDVVERLESRLESRLE